MEKNIYITPFHNLKPVAMTIIAYLNVELNLEQVYNILKDTTDFKIRYKEKLSFSSNIINISYKNNEQNINIKISTDNIHYTGLKSMIEAQELSYKLMDLMNYKREDYKLNIKKVMINYNFHIGFCINKIKFVEHMNEPPFQISFDNTFNQHIKVYHYYNNSENKRVRETLIVRWKGSVTISSSDDVQMEKSYYLFLSRINTHYDKISILDQPILVSFTNIENEEIDEVYIKSKMQKFKSLIDKNADKHTKTTKQDLLKKLVINI